MAEGIDHSVLPQAGCPGKVKQEVFGRDVGLGESKGSEEAVDFLQGAGKPDAGDLHWAGTSSGRGPMWT